MPAENLGDKAALHPEVHDQPSPDFFPGLVDRRSPDVSRDVGGRNTALSRNGSHHVFNAGNHSGVGFDRMGASHAHAA